MFFGLISFLKDKIFQVGQIEVCKIIGSPVQLNEIMKLQGVKELLLENEVRFLKHYQNGVVVSYDKVYS